MIGSSKSGPGWLTEPSLNLAICRDQSGNDRIVSDTDGDLRSYLQWLWVTYSDYEIVLTSISILFQGVWLAKNSAHRLFP